jgi:inner membrane protein
MQKALMLRIATIGLLMLLLLIPLAFIQGVVSERQFHQQHVEQTVTESTAGTQRVTAPLLVIPYVWRETVKSTDNNGKITTQIVTHNKRVVLVAEAARYVGNADVETKYKGIYKVLTYQNKGRWKASFAVPSHAGLDVTKADIDFGEAYVAMGIADLRGLAGEPRMTWQSSAFNFANGAEIDGFGSGLHAIIGDLNNSVAKRYDAEIDLSLNGSNALSFVPLGKSSSVTLRSAWPHPNFSGQYLPLTKTIDETGFSANWEVSHLASRNSTVLNELRPTQEGAKAVGQFEAFHVSFIEPVNIYQQVERAVKYGILFIALTFACFFIFEMMSGLRLHAMQYGLVGLALAIFFLLLISVTEHVPFWAAYLTASVACVTLIGSYLSSVLGSKKRGGIFAASLAMLYAILFGILLSEDNALLMGTILLFVVLSAVMMLTKKLNWYAIGQAEQKVI